MFQTLRTKLQWMFVFIIWYSFQKELKLFIDKIRVTYKEDKEAILKEILRAQQITIDQNRVLEVRTFHLWKMRRMNFYNPRDTILI